jgi:hypothetical protein
MRQVTKFEYVLLKLVSKNEGISWYGLGTYLSDISIEHDTTMMTCLRQLADEDLLIRDGSDTPGIDSWYITEHGLKSVSLYEELTRKNNEESDN